MCADTCKDAQRRSIMAQKKAFGKRFLLLCNILVVIRALKNNNLY